MEMLLKKEISLLHRFLLMARGNKIREDLCCLDIDVFIVENLISTSLLCLEDLTAQFKRTSSDLVHLLLASLPS